MAAEPVRPERADDISDRRSKAVLWSGATGLGAQVVVALLGLAVARIAFVSLGQAAYGAFAALVLVPQLLASADFGLGLGLTTLLTRARARGSALVQGQLVSTALVLMTAAGVAVGLVVLAVIPVLAPAVVSWTDGAILLAQARGSLVVIALGLMIGIPGTVGLRVLWAHQRGAYVGPMTAAGAAASLAASWWVADTHPSPSWFVVATYLVPTCVIAASAVVVVRRLTGERRPSWARVDRRTASSLWRAGALFFILNAAVAVAYQSDLFVVNAVAGSDSGAVYAVALKLYSAGFLVFGLFTRALWPGLTDALTRGDHAWVRHSLRSALLGGLGLLAVFGVVVTVLNRPLARLLSGGELTGLPAWLMAGFVLWLVLAALVEPMAMLLNAAHIVQRQLWAAVLMAAVNLALSIWLTRTYGVAGPIWGTLIAQLAITLPVYGLTTLGLLSGRIKPADEIASDAHEI